MKKETEDGVWYDNKNGFASIQNTQQGAMLALASKPYREAHELTLTLDPKTNSVMLQVVEGNEFKICKLFDMITLLEKQGLKVDSGFIK